MSRMLTALQLIQAKLPETVAVPIPSLPEDPFALGPSVPEVASPEISSPTEPEPELRETPAEISPPTEPGPELRETPPDPFEQEPSPLLHQADTAASVRLAETALQVESGDWVEHSAAVQIVLELAPPDCVDEATAVPPEAYPSPSDEASAARSAEPQASAEYCPFAPSDFRGVSLTTPDRDTTQAFESGGHREAKEGATSSAPAMDPPSTQPGVSASTPDISQASKPTQLAAITKAREGRHPGGDGIAGESSPSNEPATSGAAAHEPPNLLRPPPAEHQAEYRQVAERLLSQVGPIAPALLMFASPFGSRPTATALVPLAIGVTQWTNEEVLLVDATPTLPSVASQFGIWEGPGLVDVVRGMESWQSVVRRTAINRLSILPWGNETHSPGGSLDLGELAPVLESLRATYRLILLDTPLVEEMNLAPLAGSCDGSYLVLELGVTHSSTARRSVRTIQDAGGRILGSLLLGAPDSRPG